MNMQEGITDNASGKYQVQRGQQEQWSLFNRGKRNAEQKKRHLSCILKGKQESDKEEGKGVQEDGITVEFVEHFTTFQSLR